LELTKEKSSEAGNWISCRGWVWGGGGGGELKMYQNPKKHKQNPQKKKKKKQRKKKRVTIGMGTQIEYASCMKGGTSNW